MRVAFRLVDVFTDRPFTGNQLCVVPDPVAIPDQTMRTLAAEIGFSETTFVTSAGGDRYAMRIFTPGYELPFAGHPSLGTAFVLVAEGRVTSPVTQVVAAGEFPLTVDVDAGWARMRQHAPVFEAPLDPAARAAMTAAIGLGEDEVRADLPARVVSTGIGHVMFPLRDPAAVARAQADRSALVPLLRAAGCDGVYLFAATDAPGGAAAKARLFAPVAGVDEDPATGSAAGPLGAYLVHHGVMPSGNLTISQGEEIRRPSTLHVEVRPEGDALAVWVAGGVRVVGDGAFTVPD